jgi:hypothetical protein
MFIDLPIIITPIVKVILITLLFLICQALFEINLFCKPMKFLLCLIQGLVFLPFQDVEFSDDTSQNKVNYVIEGASVVCFSQEALEEVCQFCDHCIIA